MEYNSNTKELLARLALIRANIAAGTFSDALVAGLNAGMGVMKRRIFNQSLDTLGRTLGPYFSESWERERQRNGRQISRKDLEFTGSLRRSIEVVTVNNTRAEMRITNPDDADIARKQEKQIGELLYGSGPIAIFGFSQEEQEIAQSVTRELLQQKLTFL